MLIADTDILIWILRQDKALVERFKEVCTGISRQD